MKEKARQDSEEAIAKPLDAYHSFFLENKRFMGGDGPSIADIRLAATLEFLKAIDYDFPQWAVEYMGAVESALGEAYSEPAEDVRAFVANAKAQVA
jgi:glutathione S-transferase